MRSRSSLPRSPKRLLAVFATALAGCGAATTAAPPETGAPGSAGVASSAVVASSAPAPLRPVRILVTNDDGVGAPGIDAAVEALRTLPGVELTVVAPADQQSGTGGSTTEGPLSAFQTMTASGFPAVAVQGFPADTVRWAIDDHGVANVPDLVVSGINAGQNLGPNVDHSGTVGAARAAAQRGVPSIAISQGGSGQEGVGPDFAAGAESLLGYLAGHLDGLIGVPPTGVVNINVPTCATGLVLHGMVELPSEDSIADAGLASTAQDCASAEPPPQTEVAAFNAGYVTVTGIRPVPMG